MFFFQSQKISDFFSSGCYTSNLLKPLTYKTGLMFLQETPQDFVICHPTHHYNMPQFANLYDGQEGY